MVQVINQAINLAKRLLIIVAQNLSKIDREINQNIGPELNRIIVQEIVELIKGEEADQLVVPEVDPIIDQVLKVQGDIPINLEPELVTDQDKISKLLVAPARRKQHYLA